MLEFSIDLRYSLADQKWIVVSKEGSVSYTAKTSEALMQAIKTERDNQAQMIKQRLAKMIGIE